MFDGYYENPELTKTVWDNDIYHTGDTAWRDEDGYFFFVGRTDDVIKSSGYRIGPFEIESVIMEHPSVLECAVTAAPDPVRGQVVKATIVLARGYAPSEELKKEIRTLFSRDREKSSLFITVLSFGFKYGIPSDADLVFDVRFLPNPYYVEELRFHTGMEEPVRDYVMQGGTAAEFLEKLMDLLRFLIPRYEQEGKNQLVIAVGCTGGKHRSVAIAHEVFKRLKEAERYEVRMEHRDADVDGVR